MGNLSRKPNSNEIPVQAGNKWCGENELVDATALLLWGKAWICAICKRPILNKHIKHNLCPDCREEK